MTEQDVKKQDVEPQDENGKEERKTLLQRVKLFFFPPPGTPWYQRAAPYALLGLLTLLVLTGGVYAWDYTNSPAFCGTTCHTMPPEYAAYQVSPHARVDCVECHIGRGFVATRITRKAGDLKHVTSLAFRQYEFPIRADELRPARDTCERCHYPAKFSDDSLRQNVNYANDRENSRESIYLAMRTGGGSAREGLGRGIHWHIENEVYYVATDDVTEQNIPYVRVVKNDGSEDVYMALDSEYTEEELEEMEEHRMDCMSCHNRISHSISSPEEAVDSALARQQIASDIPYIRRLGVQVLSGQYNSQAGAFTTINDLNEYYEREFPEYYAENEEKVTQAVEKLKAIYEDSVYHEQEVDWTTHPNNIGHREWPGCFRCHDGQHVNAEGQAVRLECNLCHSIPEVVDPGILEPVLPLATGNQPSSHFSTHWINRHREEFDDTCQACHTVGNPGGVDNSSFCANEACHGVSWDYANLDAPGIRDILASDVPPDEGAGEIEVGPGGPTFANPVGDLFAQRCTSCHSQSIATGQLVLETYEGAMRGGQNGPIIVPGDAMESTLVQRQQEGHFGEFTEDELQIIIEWINNGAPEN